MEFFFTGGICQNFHGQKMLFTPTFLSNFRIFHGSLFLFHGQNREISDFFHGSLFIFHAQKKKTLAGGGGRWRADTASGGEGFGKERARLGTF